jgi:hypothetical protein
MPLSGFVGLKQAETPHFFVLLFRGSSLEAGRRVERGVDKARLVPVGIESMTH